MSGHVFGIVEIGLAFAAVIGLGVWQLVAVRRSIRRDREANRAKALER